ncbi:3-dehydroquinate synthase [Corynebacterium tapiri]|uniref:3-dehydroquinate synthase n=1 Tax=Corynebacterium tapiri TaxID=1448266 RepID=A0A5C4U4U9_9CORY|nr:3-dehydroquinate synthase [Corynebacterium tapiri]TNL97774.1 3-dehydroquinate synthase [Corynebacterium tapiri]
MTTTVAVNGPQPYTVTIGQQLGDDVARRVSELAPAQTVIIHQPALSKQAEDLATAISRVCPKVHLAATADGEDGKTLEVAGRLWDQLGEWAVGRRDLIVSLGGGAATDVAGFVAASWMRGIKVLHVPTTLLAMVDAAVGGKTGINTAAGKNLVGAFHEPAGVFIDVDYLATLPRRDLIAGSAEVIKTGFIADESILETYESHPEACLEDLGTISSLVERSIKVKASVVAADLKESGLREILNYGHTFGHAVERQEAYRWRHGDAVAVGMIFIAELSRIRGLIDEDLVARHRSILESIGLPTTYQDGSFEELRAGMSRDKKNRGSQIRFVALDQHVGRTCRIEDATVDELRSAYDALVSARKE